MRYIPDDPNPLPATPEHQRLQEDVKVVSHYTIEDQPECVQALLLLAGLDQPAIPAKPDVKPPRRPPTDTAA